MHRKLTKIIKYPHTKRAEQEHCQRVVITYLHQSHLGQWRDVLFKGKFPRSHSKFTNSGFLGVELSFCIFRLLRQASEKAMAPHSSTLAWKIPWMEEPGRLQSMGSLRVRHDWVTSLSLYTFVHWRRKWQPTPVFLPGESQGWGSLVGCRLWGRTESDITEVI